MTPDGLSDLSDDIRAAHVAVAASGGVSSGTLRARLEAADLDARQVNAPSSIDNLDELGSLPSLLVGFLAVLSVVAGVSAMVLTVRRRRREIAVLRSLGFVRSQVGAAIVTQSLTVAVVALVAGIPGGLLAGRTVYQLVGSNVGFLVRPTYPVVSTLAVAAVALAAAVAGAAAVAPAAQRLAPAATLCTE